MKYITIVICICYLFASCDCNEDTRPDIKIPEFISPDLVRKHFNPFDYSGTSYRNEYYHSFGWVKPGPYLIPYSFMIPFLPAYGIYFPYYDPSGRFSISGNSNGFYEVWFANGLWNQNGFIFWGQYNVGLQTGDIVTIYKYAFNEQSSDLGNFSKCKPASADPSKVRIQVVKDVNESEETKTSVPAIQPDGFQLTSTSFIVNQLGNYEILATADIDDDVDERNENNNEEPPKPPIQWGKKKSSWRFAVNVSGQNKSEKIVTFINN